MRPTLLLLLTILAVNHVESWDWWDDFWNAENSCRQVWSRCSSWSSWAFNDCQRRCNCLGHSQGGSCVELRNDGRCWMTDSPMQCQCHGPRDMKSIVDDEYWSCY